MVGNDVVDLSDQDVRCAPHPRFDARVFAAGERAALDASGARTRLRWMLWAAKEAAYKLVRKRDPRVSFSPRRFVVRLDARLEGEVEHAGRVYAVRLGNAGDALHAVARDGSPARIVSGVAATQDLRHASRAARELASLAVAEHLGVPLDAILLGRRGRIPTLQVRGLATPLDLSLSHHGRFVAFACDLGCVPA